MARKIWTKNFTLLVLGQASSLFGNYIVRLALSMYVLDETGSAAVFAGILSAATIPAILLSPLGGILADRADRRGIMVLLDALTGCCVLCAALLLPYGRPLIVASALLVALSILGAFETPTVQACIPQMLQGDAVVKGNAAVNQVASVAYLVAPTLGGVMYAAFGVRPVLAASIACFFLTAFLECFIKLGYQPADDSMGLLTIIKHDFSESKRFILKSQPGLLKMLLFIALVRFFVMGTTAVGLPFLIRAVLSLGAAYYGAAESAIAFAAIAGSIAAGLLTGKLETRRLSLLLALLGAFLLPAGIFFLFPAGTMTRYAVTVAAFCGMQVAASIFSIFATSLIQQRTPNRLLGKVMAYTSAITLCVQPLGQILYGFLFDALRSAVALVLIPTGAAVCLIGLSSAGFFRRLERASSVPEEKRALQEKPS